MNPDRYYLVDGDHMHGPMSWDDLRALLESGTVGADAQWCREGETEFRPLSDLLELASTHAKPPPPPPVVLPPPPPIVTVVRVPAPAPTPIVVHVHTPKRSTGAAKLQAMSITAIALVIAGPFILTIIGTVLVLVMGGAAGVAIDAEKAIEQRRKEKAVAVAEAEAKEIRMLEQDMDGGSASAARLLAERYDAGRGVEKDVVKAAELRQLARDREGKSKGTTSAGR